MTNFQVTDDEVGRQRGQIVVPSFEMSPSLVHAVD
jgi:hypothetical protein